MKCKIWAISRSENNRLRVAGPAVEDDVPLGEMAIVEYPLVFHAIENGPFIVDLLVKNGDFP